MEKLNQIKNVLERQKRDYDLEGVEITTEDAENVLALINKGMTQQSAIDQVLNGIHDCLSEEY